MANHGFATAREFASWFRSASGADRAAVLASLPATMRQSMAAQFMEIDHPASALNAFEMIAGDLVMGGDPLGAVIAHGAVIVARDLHTGSDDLFLQIGSRAAVAHVDGLGMHGKLDEAVAAADEWGRWLDGLPASERSGPVRQNRESIRLKAAELLSDHGRYDLAAEEVKQVATADLSTIQRTTLEAVEQRIAMNSGQVDGSPGATAADLEQTRRQLEFMQQQLAANPILPAPLRQQIDKAVELLRSVDELTPEVAAQLDELLQGFRDLGISWPGL